MKIVIEFSTDNAAFENETDEINRILHQAAMQAAFLFGGDGGEEKLLDSNGNTVGTVTVWED